MCNPRVTRSRWPRTRRHLGSRAVPSQGRDTWLAQTFRLPGKAKRSGPCENHMGNKPPFPRTLLRDRSGRRDFSSRCLRLPLLLAAPSQNRRGRRLKFPAGSVVRLSPSQVACGGTTETSTQRGLGIRHRDLFPRERVYVVESTRGGEEARAPAWALAPGGGPRGSARTRWEGRPPEAWRGVPAGSSHPGSLQRRVSGPREGDAGPARALCVDGVSRVSSFPSP